MIKVANDAAGILGFVTTPDRLAAMTYRPTGMYNRSEVE